MTRAYAEGTSVSVAKTKTEIDALLAKHGATQRGVMSDEERCIVAFVIQGAQYRLDVPQPHRKGLTDRQWEQKCRERWRAVFLMLKAKLELVRLGVSNVQREFLADMVLPNGKTVSAEMGPLLERALQDGKMPSLMLPAAR